jgi:acylpyruvate hydrolase
VAVRIHAGEAVELGSSSVGDLLTDANWRERAAGHVGLSHDSSNLDFAPLIPSPDKIVCVGLNYRAHILEMGREVPKFPTLFAKYRAALIGAKDNIILPSTSEAVDWEAELAVIVGRSGRRLSEAEATSAIAGYSVINDITVRDWQSRTLQWLQGKTFESSTPLGPLLVTTDETAELPDHRLVCEVDGEVVQDAQTSDLVFSPSALVAYVSTIITLLPGDVIATGTPGGVGHGRQPPRYLRDGSVVVTRIEGIGECHNTCRDEE